MTPALFAAILLSSPVILFVAAVGVLRVTLRLMVWLARRDPNVAKQFIAHLSESETAPEMEPFIGEPHRRAIEELRAMQEAK